MKTFSARMKLRRSKTYMKKRKMNFRKVFRKLTTSMTKTCMHTCCKRRCCQVRSRIRKMVSLTKVCFSAMDTLPSLQCDLGVSGGHILYLAYLAVMGVA